MDKEKPIEVKIKQDPLLAFSNLCFGIAFIIFVFVALIILGLLL